MRTSTHSGNSLPYAWLAIIFLAAVALRALYVYQTATSPLFQTFQQDARWHAEWAQRIAGGQLTDDQPFFRAPLYPFFVAGVYLLCGESFVGVRIVQHLLGAASCIVVALIALRAYGRSVAILAGLMCAGYGPLIYYENELLIASMAVLLFMLMILAALRAADTPSAARLALVGILLGLCSIARPNFLLILPVLIVWWLRRNPRPCDRRALVRDIVVLCGAFAVPVAAVATHNRVWGNEWVLIASQGGVNFYIGNNPTSDGKTAVAYGPIMPEPGGHYVDNVWSNSKLVAEYETGHAMNHAEVSRFWFRKGASFWAQSPLQAMGLLVRKIYYFGNGFEIESNRSLYLDRLYSPLAAVLMWSYGIAFPLGLVMALAVIGWFLPTPQVAARSLLRWSLLTYAATVVAFFVTSRFRLPVVPLLIIFASNTLVFVWQEWCAGTRQRVWKIMLAGLALVALFNSNLCSVREVKYARQATMIGDAYLQLRRPDQALPYFQEAVEASPEHFDAHLLMGRALEWMGRYQEAESAYRKALALAPSSATVHTELGLSLLGQQRPAEAQALFVAALGLDDRDAEAHYQLGVLLLEQGAYEESLKHLQAAGELGIELDPEQVRLLEAHLPGARQTLDSN